MIALFILLLLTAFANSHETTQRSWLMDLYAENTKLELSVIATKTTDVVSSCAHFCLRHCNCKSFNFNAIKKICEILSRTRHEVGPEKLKAISG